MCLFLTITPCDPDFNRSVVKRVLKGASVLSAFPEELEGRSVFYLANSPNCACDLEAAESGTDAFGTHLSLSAVDAVERVAKAMVAAGCAPFEFRAFWAGEHPAEVVDLHLGAFLNAVQANAFHGQVAYRVGEQCAHAV